MKKQGIVLSIAACLTVLCLLPALLSGCGKSGEDAPAETQTAAQTSGAQTEKASEKPTQGALTTEADGTGDDVWNIDFSTLTDSEGLQFAPNDGGLSYTVTGPGSFDGKDLVIPAEYNGKPVTRIAESAFRDQTNIETAVFRDGVQAVGNYVFSGCTSLQRVRIPSGAIVGDALFVNCKALKGTSFGGARYVGNESAPYMILFDTPDKTVTEVTIHEDTEYIQTYAFTDCNGLTNIRIPQKIKAVGLNAFYFCKNLETVNWDAENAVQSGAFGGCTKFSALFFGNTVKSVPSFSGCRSINAVIIPESVTEIGDSAFADCSALETIRIPDSVVSIGAFAFSGCKKLKTVTMSQNLEYIGEDAFKGCDSMRYNEQGGCCYLGGENNEFAVLVKVADKASSNVRIDPQTRVILPEAFAGCTALAEITIPEGVCQIGDGVFSECGALTKVVLPSTLTRIGSDWFYYCSALTDIVIPDGVTVIESFAFCGCTSLTGLTLPEGLTNIGYGAFMGVQISELTLPQSLVFIGGYAFEQTGLRKLTIPKNVIYVGEGVAALSRVSEIEVEEGNENYEALDGCLIEKDSKTLLGVFGNYKIPTDGRVEKIGEAVFFYEQSRYFEVPEGIKTIGMAAFAYCGITTIVLPSTLTEIEEDAFYRSNIRLVINRSALPIRCGERDYGGVATAAYAVKNADGSTSYLYEGLDLTDDLFLFRQANDTWFLMNYLGQEDEIVLPADHGGEPYLPSGFTGADKVTVPGSVKTLPGYSFLTGRTENYARQTPSVILLEEGVEEIDSYAFYGCVNLRTIDIPASVRKIGDAAFAGCAGLQFIRVDPANEYYFSWGNCLLEKETGRLIAYCGGSLPTDGSVKILAAGAFEDDRSLQTLKIPASVTTIEQGAFTGCTNLAGFEIEQGSEYFAFESGCLIEKQTGTLLLAFTGAEIPRDGSVLAIGEGAFGFDQGLTEIYIPSSVKVIGANAFRGCSKLKKILYAGSESAWAEIEVSPEGNELFAAAKVQYNAE